MSVASHYDYVQCFPGDFVDAYGKFLSQISGEKFQFNWECLLLVSVGAVIYL